jgi:ParB-like chromosome segregation protein Spo0J
MTAASRDIPLARIDDDRSLAYRDGLDRWEGGEALLASLDRRGILRPVTLRPAIGGQHQPAAGFRRLEAARALGLVSVPAHVDDAPPAEIFLTAVEEHSGQPVNLRERARAVAIAAGLVERGELDDARASSWLVHRILPALGLQPSARLVEQLLRFAALSPALADLLVNKAFSLRRCLPFCGLAAADAEHLAALGRVHRLGGRRMEEAFTWTLEVARRDGMSVAEVCEELDLLGEGEGLSRLEARRLPETTLRRLELAALARRLHDAGVTARYDENLGSTALELSVSAGGAAELDEALDALSDDKVRRLARELLAQIEEI